MTTYTRFPGVIQILQELQDDPHYKAAVDRNGPSFEQFRQDVEALWRKCFRDDTTPAEIRADLEMIEKDCFGSEKARFKKFFTQALASPEVAPGA